MNELRDYQLSMLQALRKAWRRHQSVMVQMPTGTGKTHLMAAAIRDQSDGNVLVVAHRRELLEQIRQTMEAFGLSEKQVRVESIQRLSKHIDETDFRPSLVVIDEAHHALAKTYKVLWEKWPKAKFLGLTATPCRLNRAPFTDLFQKLLQSWPIQEFIDKGWLSDFDYVSASPNSEVMKQVRSMKKRGADGDYQTAELALVMDVPASIEHLYKTYKEFARGKKGIVYAIDRQHAQHIADYYRSEGVRCAVIDSKTPAEERQRIINEYKLQPPPLPPTLLKTLREQAPASGRTDGSGTAAHGLDVLINVDIFSEGFDCPEVEFIQLARPTLSLSKYLQQVGRGMRVSPGKPHVLILDNVGLYQTFGLPTEERDWRQTFYGMESGKGMADSSRMVVLADDDKREKELVNLEMVCIKKVGKRGAGLEIFLKDGYYGVRNNGRVSCQARFKQIVRLNDPSGFFAAGIYGGLLYGRYVEYASLIDRKGIDQNLRLFRDVYWSDGIYYSCYKPKGYREGDNYWDVYWDPKGNCYYDDNPAFRRVAGVEIAEASEHERKNALCYKLRYSTGRLSPRFNLSDLFFNRNIIIARDYLIVKRDKNHAYRICGYLDHSVIVQKEDLSGYQQFFLDGRKGESFRGAPPGMSRLSPISHLHYQKNLGLQCL